MTILRSEFLGSVGWSILGIVVLIIGLITYALHKKDHVKAGLWLRSFGFFLEAGNARRKR